MDKKILQPFIKYLYGVICIILITMGVLLEYGGRIFSQATILFLSQLSLGLMTLCAGVLCMVCGGFMAYKAYIIFKKPFANYREDPQTVGADRILTKKRDIVADKIWNCIMLGSLGSMSLFIGAMFLKLLFVDFIPHLMK